MEQWTAFISNGENIAFLILAICVISGAILMLSFSKVVHMVISAGASFLGLGGLFILLQAEFVAFVQILVYAGSITILMIFGIMMTRQDQQQQQQQPKIHRTIALVGVLGFFGVLFYAIQQAAFPMEEASYVEENVGTIGEQLFTMHVIPFELVSVLLTVALIGAIVIAKREED